MTTRARRSKPQQVRDILLSWLKEQDAKAEKLHLAWEDVIEGADRTRRMIELLDQAMLPGMEPEPPIEPEGMLTLPPPNPRPRRQRIGGKAQRISDVWSASDRREVLEVHTALMYSRQDSCEWCRKGVPFATEERTGHHVIISYADGVERGFSVEPCKGVA